MTYYNEKYLFDAVKYGDSQFVIDIIKGEFDPKNIDSNDIKKFSSHQYQNGMTIFHVIDFALIVHKDNENIKEGLRQLAKKIYNGLEEQDLRDLKTLETHGGTTVEESTSYLEAAANYQDNNKDQDDNKETIQEDMLDNSSGDKTDTTAAISTAVAIPSGNGDITITPFINTPDISNSSIRYIFKNQDFYNRYLSSSTGGINYPMFDNSDAYKSIIPSGNGSGAGQNNTAYGSYNASYNGSYTSILESILDFMISYNTSIWQPLYDDIAYLAAFATSCIYPNATAASYNGSYNGNNTSIWQPLPAAIAIAAVATSHIYTSYFPQAFIYQTAAIGIATLGGMIYEPTVQAAPVILGLLGLLAAGQTLYDKYYGYELSDDEVVKFIAKLGKYKNIQNDYLVKDGYTPILVKKQIGDGSLEGLYSLSENLADLPNEDFVTVLQIPKHSIFFDHYVAIKYLSQYKTVFVVDSKRPAKKLFTNEASTPAGDSALDQALKNKFADVEIIYAKNAVVQQTAFDNTCGLHSASNAVKLATIKDVQAFMRQDDLKIWSGVKKGSHAEIQQKFQKEQKDGFPAWKRLTEKPYPYLFNLGNNEEDQGHNDLPLDGAGAALIEDVDEIPVPAAERVLQPLERGVDVEHALGEAVEQEEVANALDNDPFYANAAAGAAPEEAKEAAVIANNLLGDADEAPHIEDLALPHVDEVPVPAAERVQPLEREVDVDHAVGGAIVEQEKVANALDNNPFNAVAEAAPEEEKEEPVAVPAQDREKELLKQKIDALDPKVDPISKSGKLLESENNLDYLRQILNKDVNNKNNKKIKYLDGDDDNFPIALIVQEKIGRDRDKVLDLIGSKWKAVNMKQKIGQFNELKKQFENLKRQATKEIHVTEDDIGALSAQRRNLKNLQEKLRNTHEELNRCKEDVAKMHDLVDPKIQHVREQYQYNKLKIAIEEFNEQKKHIIAYNASQYDDTMQKLKRKLTETKEKLSREKEYFEQLQKEALLKQQEEVLKQQEEVLKQQEEVLKQQEEVKEESEPDNTVKGPKVKGEPPKFKVNKKKKLLKEKMLKDYKDNYLDSFPELNETLFNFNIAAQKFVPNQNLQVVVQEDDQRHDDQEADPNLAVEDANKVASLFDLEDFEERKDDSIPDVQYDDDQDGNVDKTPPKRFIMGDMPAMKDSVRSSDEHHSLHGIDIRKYSNELPFLLDVENQPANFHGEVEFVDQPAHFDGKVKFDLDAPRKASSDQGKKLGKDFLSEPSSRKSSENTLAEELFEAYKHIEYEAKKGRFDKKWKELIVKEEKYWGINKTYYKIEAIHDLEAIAKANKKTINHFQNHSEKLTQQMSAYTKDTKSMVGTFIQRGEKVTNDYKQLVRDINTFIEKYENSGVIMDNGKFMKFYNALEKFKGMSGNDNGISHIRKPSDSVPKHERHLIKTIEDISQQNKQEAEKAALSQQNKQEANEKAIALFNAKVNEYLKLQQQKNAGIQRESIEDFKDPKEEEKTGPKKIRGPEDLEDGVDIQEVYQAVKSGAIPSSSSVIEGIEEIGQDRIIIDSLPYSESVYHADFLPPVIYTGQQNPAIGDCVNHAFANINKAVEFGISGDLLIDNHHAAASFNLDDISGVYFARLISEQGNYGFNGQINHNIIPHEFMGYFMYQEQYAIGNDNAMGFDQEMSHAGGVLPYVDEKEGYYNSYEFYNENYEKFNKAFMVYKGLIIFNKALYTVNIGFAGIDVFKKGEKLYNEYDSDTKLIDKSTYNSLDFAAAAWKLKSLLSSEYGVVRAIDPVNEFAKAGVSCYRGSEHCVDNLREAGTEAVSSYMDYVITDYAIASFCAYAFNIYAPVCYYMSAPINIGLNYVGISAKNPIKNSINNAYYDYINGAELLYDDYLYNQIELHNSGTLYE